MEMQEEHIRNKITEIGSAIFYNVSQAPKMISIGLISSVSYDEEGRLYFFTPRPQYLQKEDIHFPAELDFYKKGTPVFIKINGMAEVLTDDHEIDQFHLRYLHSLIEPARRSAYALIRLNVHKVEYIDHSAKSIKFFEKIRSAFTSWF